MLLLLLPHVAQLLLLLPNLLPMLWRMRIRCTPSLTLMSFCSTLTAVGTAW
jgi:hypothetical protein